MLPSVKWDAAVCSIHHLVGSWWSIWERMKNAFITLCYHWQVSYWKFSVSDTHVSGKIIVVAFGWVDLPRSHWSYWNWDILINWQFICRSIWIDRQCYHGYEHISERGSEKSTHWFVAWFAWFDVFFKQEKCIHDVFRLDVSERKFLNSNNLFHFSHLINEFMTNCVQTINSYPDYTPILIRAIELWPHDPQVTTPILKLFAELVQNRSQRLQFDISSPNGILLFREASKVICTYGKYWQSTPLFFGTFSMHKTVYFQPCMSKPNLFMEINRSHSLFNRR